MQNGAFGPTSADFRGKTKTTPYPFDMNPEQRRQRLLEYLPSGLIVGHRLCWLLGISERTLFRDVALLRKRGHVVHANPGPGGGLWLGDEGKLLPCDLSITDVRELAYAVARSASQGALLLNEFPKSLHAKLLACLPATRAGSITAVLNQIPTARPYPHSTLESAVHNMEQAMRHGLQIHAHFRPDGIQHQRFVQPQSMQPTEGEWAFEFTDLHTQKHWRLAGRDVVRLRASPVWPRFPTTPDTSTFPYPRTRGRCTRCATDSATRPWYRRRSTTQPSVHR